MHISINDPNYPIEVVQEESVISTDPDQLVLLPEQVMLEQFGLSTADATDETFATYAEELDNPDLLPRLEQIARTLYFGSFWQQGQNAAVVQSGITELRDQIWEKVALSTDPVGNAESDLFLVRAGRAVVNAEKRAMLRVYGVLEQKASRTDKTGTLRSWDKMTAKAQAELCARMCTYGVILPIPPKEGETGQGSQWSDVRFYDADLPNGERGRLQYIAPRRLIPRVVDTSAMVAEKVKAALSTHTTLNDRKRINPAVLSSMWPKVTPPDMPDMDDNPDLPDWVVKSDGLLGNMTLPLIPDKKGILRKQRIVDVRGGTTRNLGTPYTPPYDAKMGRIGRNGELMEHTVHIAHSAESVCIQEVWDFHLQMALWDFLPLEFVVRKEDFASNGKKGDKKDVRSRGRLNWTEAVKLALYAQPSLKWSAPPIPEKENKRQKADREASPGTWSILPGPDDMDGYTANGYQQAKRAITAAIGKQARLIVDGSEEHLSGKAVEAANKYLKGTDTLELFRSIHNRYYSVKEAEYGGIWDTSGVWHTSVTHTDIPAKRWMADILADVRRYRANTTKAFNRYMECEDGTKVADLQKAYQNARKALEVVEFETCHHGWAVSARKCGKCEKGEW